MPNRLNLMRFERKPLKPEIAPEGIHNEYMPGRRNKTEATALRELLAHNLQLVAARHFPETTQIALGEFFGVGAGTIGRINRAEAGASIDILQTIAKTIGWEAWMLLVPLTTADEKPSLVTPEMRAQLAEARQITEAVDKARHPRPPKQRAG